MTRATGSAHGPDFAAQPDFAEDDDLPGQGLVLDAGDDRQDGAQVGRRLVDGQAAGHVEIDVLAAEVIPELLSR